MVASMWLHFSAFGYQWILFQACQGLKHLHAFIPQRAVSLDTMGVQRMKAEISGS